MMCSLFLAERQGYRFTSFRSFVHSRKKIPTVLSCTSFTAPPPLLLRKSQGSRSPAPCVHEKIRPNGRIFSWRRDRDSNPGYLAVHTRSRRANSTTLAPLRTIFHSISLCLQCSRRANQVHNLFYIILDITPCKNGSHTQALGRFKILRPVIYKYAALCGYIELFEH